jgi:hypothetical protein
MTFGESININSSLDTINIATSSNNTSNYNSINNITKINNRMLIRPSSGRNKINIPKPNNI